MPIARVQMPDGRIGKFEVPEGTTPEQVESFVFNNNDAYSNAERNREKTSELMAIPAGINSLLPQTLGLPMDTMTNIANLGVVGEGMRREVLRKILPKSISEKLIPEGLPDIIPDQPLGSKWIANKISGALGADVFSNPRPDSQLAQMLHTGSNVAASGLLNPASSIKEAAGNVASMIPSAIGAATAQQISDNPLAPMVGAALPVAIRAGIQAYADRKPSNPIQEQTLKSSQDAGYTVPPTQAKPTLINKTLEGIAGKISTAQKSALKNQDITNSLAKEELGIDAPITKEVLKDIRDQSGVVYEKAKNLGTFTTDLKFHDELARLSKNDTALSKELPQLFNKDIQKLVGSFNKENISSSATVEAIKELRSQASDNFLTDPSKARVQKNIANALEGLMERNIQGKAGPEFLKEFRDARAQIAKTYSIEKALNESTGNVSATKLARQLDKGVPLSGNLKTVAQFGKAYPKAAQEINSSIPGISPLDVTAGSITSAAAGHPGFLAMITGRPLIRSMLLSKWYQNSLSPNARYIPPDISKVSALLANQERKQDDR